MLNIADKIIIAKVMYSYVLNKFLPSMTKTYF